VGKIRGLRGSRPFPRQLSSGSPHRRQAHGLRPSTFPHGLLSLLVLINIKDKKQPAKRTVQFGDDRRLIFSASQCYYTSRRRPTARTSTAADTVVSSNFGAATVNGAVTFAPTTSTTYTLIVQGPGGTATASVLVQVFARDDIRGVWENV